MDLITYMKHERSGEIRGVYRRIQTYFAFNSNKIEGSQLSREQTQHLFDENKIYTENGESIALDDITEATNHFNEVLRMHPSLVESEIATLLEDNKKFSNHKNP